MSDEEPAQGVEVLESVMQALNRRDLDAAMGFFVDDCVFEAQRGRRPEGRRVEGKADVQSAFTVLLDRFPNLRYTNITHWVCGQRGVSEWTLVRTSGGKNSPVVRGCDLWELPIARTRDWSRRSRARGIRPGGRPQDRASGRSPISRMWTVGTAKRHRDVGLRDPCRKGEAAMLRSGHPRRRRLGRRGRRGTS